MVVATVSWSQYCPAGNDITTPRFTNVSLSYALSENSGRITYATRSCRLPKSESQNHSILDSRWTPTCKTNRSSCCAHWLRRPSAIRKTCWDHSKSKAINYTPKKLKWFLESVSLETKSQWFQGRERALSHLSPKSSKSSRLRMVLVRSKGGEKWLFTHTRRFRKSQRFPCPRFTSTTARIPALKP